MYRDHEDPWQQAEFDALETETLDDSLDKEFKPGLFRMVEAFLEGKEDQRLTGIWEHHAKSKDIYTVMLPEQMGQCQKARIGTFGNIGMTS